MGRIVELPKWATIVLIVLFACLVGYGVYFLLSDRNTYTPPVPVKLTAEQLESPVVVATELGLTKAQGEEVVREVAEVAKGNVKPIAVFDKVPVAEIPKKIEQVAKVDKPDKIVTSEPDTKTVNVYSIHTEKLVRWGVAGGIDQDLKNKTLGIAQKNRDNVYILKKNFDTNRIEGEVVHLF